MAIAVVLLLASEAEPSLHPTVVSKLARLGVTSVAIVRDEETVGLVVEGWAFDPDRSATAIVEAVAGSSSRARTLYPLLQLAVSTGLQPRDEHALPFGMAGASGEPQRLGDGGQR